MKLLAFCASLVTCLSVSAQQASAPASAAPTTDPITYSTVCGAPGVGRLVGSAEPVARSASEAAGTYVNADGYWATPCPLIATPGTTCGAPGVGRMPGYGMLAKDNANAAAGWRVDADGLWQPCDRPCFPEQREAFRTWSDGAHVCTTYNRYDSDGNSRARDRVLLHGELGRWEQWLGDMRGVLHERCDDGVRTRTLAACAPATHCAQRWSRDGMVYDGRGPGAAVPLGGYATATAPDGRQLRIQCVGGDFQAEPQCASGQEVTRMYSWQLRVYRYSGPPVDVGARVRAEQVHVVDTRSGEQSAGANKIRFTIATCGVNGRLQ